MTEKIQSFRIPPVNLPQNKVNDDTSCCLSRIAKSIYNFIARILYCIFCCSFGDKTEKPSLQDKVTPPPARASNKPKTPEPAPRTKSGASQLPPVTKLELPAPLIPSRAEQPAPTSLSSSPATSTTPTPVQPQVWRKGVLPKVPVPAFVKGSKPIFRKPPAPKQPQEQQQTAPSAIPTPTFTPAVTPMFTQPTPTTPPSEQQQATFIPVPPPTFPGASILSFISEPPFVPSQPTDITPLPALQEPVSPIAPTPVLAQPFTVSPGATEFEDLQKLAGSLTPEQAAQALAWLNLQQTNPLAQPTTSFVPSSPSPTPSRTPSPSPTSSVTFSPSITPEPLSTSSMMSSSSLAASTTLSDDALKLQRLFEKDLTNVQTSEIDEILSILDSITDPGLSNLVKDLKQTIGTEQPSEQSDSTTEEYRPSEVIMGQLHQGDDFSGANSCTFQAMAFLNKFYTDNPREITASFINQVILDGTTAYATVDGGNHDLYDPSEVPTDGFFPALVNASGDQPLAGIISSDRPAINFFQQLAILPTQNGISGAVMTLRGESYGVLVRDSKVYFFNSHGYQQGQHVKANVKVFDTIVHFSTFLAHYYRAEVVSEDNAYLSNSNIPIYADAFDNANISDDADADTIRSAIADMFQEETFTTELINDIQLYRMTRAEREANRGRALEVNQFTLTPFLPVLS